jgi:hypothetical protein
MRRRGTIITLAVLAGIGSMIAFAVHQDRASAIERRRAYVKDLARCSINRTSSSSTGTTMWAWCSSTATARWSDRAATLRNPMTLDALASPGCTASAATRSRCRRNDKLTTESRITELWVALHDVVHEPAGRPYAARTGNTC